VISENVYRGGCHQAVAMVDPGGFWRRRLMRRQILVLLVAVATLSQGCIATRKFTRNEVKTSADTLSARIDENKGEINEVRDGVTRVDARVTGVDGKVSQLDSRTTERFEGVKGDIQNVDKKYDTKVGEVQTATQRVATSVTSLDEKFQNRNQFSVATEKAVLFKFDSAKLDSKYQSDLEEVASLLQKNPDAVLILEGRTDKTGDQDYNVKLGERRVEAVKRFLAVDLGVPIYRIHEISFGAAKPVNPNENKEGREKNRAVMLQVLQPKNAAGSITRNPNQ
jgi:outer membrane protein OmpA-like peptidoglycan-associated protein